MLCDIDTYEDIFAYLIIFVWWQNEKKCNVICLYMYIKGPQVGSVAVCLMEHS